MQHEETSTLKKILKTKLTDTSNSLVLMTLAFIQGGSNKTP